MNNTIEKKKDLDEAVYALTRMIPKGRVSTYGLIAKALGVGRSSRLVGMILSKSHSQTQEIPAHRVVNRNGILTGKQHFQHPDQMQQLLEEEGVIVRADKVVDFEQLVWDPQQELEF